VNGFTIYMLLAVVVSILFHAFCKNFILASTLAAALCAIGNVVDEILRAARAHPGTFEIRPSDLVFWLPMDFLMGAVPALIVATITGLPFLFVRRATQKDSHSGPTKSAGIGS